MDFMAAVKTIEQAVRQNKLGTLAAEPQILQGDGSDRRFFRLTLKPGRAVVAILPPLTAAPFSKEAASAAAISRHLTEKGVAVPRLLAFAPDSGLLLCEDAGDTHLAALVNNYRGNDDRIEALYLPVIEALLHMQIKGAEGFNVAWCWEAPRYDRRTMLEREGGYFLDSFCRNYHGLKVDNPAIMLDIERIISKIENMYEKQGEYFLHRDFQSRNILVLADGSLRIIDYQAGRFGPLAYDLASLLIDPYVALSPALQQRLLDYYCQQLEQEFGLDSGLLRTSYGPLACMRNLQILGAFSFLFLQKKKVYFEQFIPAALSSLVRRLDEEWAADLSALRGLVKTLVACQHPLEKG